MDRQLQLVAVLTTLAFLLAVLELVRRRRLMERYALLWLFSAVVLLGLGIWRGLLEKVADAVGIAYPPSALFVIAVFFILVLLLHFSVAVSRLADQSKVLAQRVALLEQRLGERGSRRTDRSTSRGESEVSPAITAIERETTSELERRPVG